MRGGKDLNRAQITDLMKPFEMENARKLACLNPWAAKRWSSAVDRQNFPEQSVDYRLFTVTIIPEVGLIDLKVSRTAEELHQELIEIGSKVQQKCRNLLTGKCDFLLMLEVALIVVNNRERFLSVHAHGFAWGNEAIIAKPLKSLPKVLGNVPGGEIKPCRSRLGWLSYITKDPRTKSILNQLPGGKWLCPMRQHLTKEDQLTLIEAFGSLTKPEMAFASGVGVPILKAARHSVIGRGYKKFSGNRWKPRG